MKKRGRLLLSIILILSLFYCVNSFADGGGPLPPPTGCDEIPTPDYDGPLIKGTFTAAWDRSQCTVDSPDYWHYNIHVVLEGVKLENGREISIKKLYSLHADIKADVNVPPRSLCDYNPLEWKDKFKYMACDKKVSVDFGFSKKDDSNQTVRTHYPVLTDVWIAQKDNCSDYKGSVISGTIKIRMTEIPDQEPE